jgi:hypothetical protein
MFGLFFVFCFCFCFFSLGWPGTRCVAQDGLELTIFLPQLSPGITGVCCHVRFPHFLKDRDLEVETLFF